MFKFLRHANTLKKLAAILILLVLLPAVFYSAYEISSLTQSETMIEQIYRQQLDALLFSLNQYAWDVANGWAGDVSRMVKEQLTTISLAPRADFQELIRSNKGIEALFVTDTAATSVALACFSPSDSTHPQFREVDFVKLVRSEEPRITRLLQLQRTGYRKIEGVPVTSSKREPATCLLFVANGSQNRVFIAGIVLDAESFIVNVLGRKLDEAGGDEFLLSILRKSDRRQIYATGPFARGMERQTKELWLFPDYVVGIRLRGQTIEELVRERFYRNLSLLAILDAMIVIGVWFVYRTIRREMELAQLKSDFVSNVSHELRTPLALIRMFSETLEMGRVPTEEKRKEYYSTIVRESERLTGLVNNVLNFSRIESGKKEYHISKTDLNAVVHKVLASYQSHLEHQGFTLVTDLETTLPLIPADEEALSEAIINVVDNAIKYSKAQKSIRITTGIAGPNIFVDVQDHGIGIPSEEQPRIFEKFYRVSSGLVHEVRGSGLGLTLVRHIMDAHKGEISIQSRVDEGSTFRLSFPISTEQESQINRK